MRFVNAALLTAVLLSGMVASAVAAPITPTYDTFGTLAGATFGGSGIPNDAVATSTFVDGGNTFTIGLTAHQRFVGPNLLNDGAGTFEAPTGESAPGLSKWNFAYYIDVASAIGATPLSAYSLQLLYDFDPGVATDDLALGKITVPVPAHAEDSQNLGFAFLDTPSIFVTPPTYPSFNPNVNGEYTFAIRVSNNTGLLDETAIRVNATPEPGSLTLFGLGALGLVGAARRRRKNAPEAI